MSRSATTDCLIVGGGAVGLSLAFELASHGRSVRLLERGDVGREASWAGAGILPPGAWYSNHPALEQLAAESHRLNREWSERLAEMSGIDDEHHRCGGLYCATPDKAPALEAKFDRWRALGINVRRVTTDEFAGVTPGGGAFFVPDECQVRNPRRLESLRLACERRGVRVERDTAAQAFESVEGRVATVETGRGAFSADHFLLAAGAWTGGLAQTLRQPIATRPVRGQMLLLRTPERRVIPNVHAHDRYVVSRRDGRVLVGSTVEDAGFDKSTTPEEVDALKRFAAETAPCLAEAEVEAAWAGLRPGSDDGLPAIGLLPGLENAWIASGHFRAGLQYAAATAVLVRQLLDGEPPSISAEAFSPSRFADCREEAREGTKR